MSARLNREGESPPGLAGRGLWGSLTLVLLLAGCAESHQGPQSCDPVAVDGCPDGQVCRETWEGEYQCMQTCDDLEFLLCENGATCAARRPGPEWVCWTGGDREKGDACSHSTECKFGLTCNRLRICEDACRVHGAECETPGYVCIHSRCQPPIPRDTPCASITDCDPHYLCRPDTLFTCQPRCLSGGVCEDGMACAPTAPAGHCDDRELPRFDTCERMTDWAPARCGDGEACVLTSAGVRRCVRAGCSRETGCGVDACLPDPEAPDTLVCWPGGTVRRGEPCTGSHECQRGDACNLAGVCAHACENEGDPCVSMPGHVCRDHVCTPEP